MDSRSVEHILATVFLCAFAFYMGYTMGGRGYSVIDTETRTIIERPAMGQYDGQWFPIGSKLTSTENGDIIIAPEGTPDELIIAIIE